MSVPVVRLSAFQKFEKRLARSTCREARWPRRAGSCVWAIAKHQKLQAASVAVCKIGDDDKTDAAIDAAFEALAELAAITPTTIPGCVAMLRVHQITVINTTMATRAMTANCSLAIRGCIQSRPDLLLRLADRIEQVQS